MSNGKHIKLLERVWEALERTANENNHRRTYLGMSGIGGNCDRKTWAEFRHAFTSHINYKSESFFADGHYSEEVFIKRMIAAGIELQTVGETDDGQIAVQSMYWLRGHLDGKLVWNDVKGVWEHKSTNDEKLLKLKKYIAKDESTALKKWDKQYYVQAQLYMGHENLDTHILTAAAHGTREKVNKNGDFRTAICETKFNKKDYDEYIEKSRNLIVTDQMPKANSSLEYDMPLCIWANGRCEAYDFCKGREIAEPNCRNCAYVTFTTEGAECTNDKYKEDNVFAIDTMTEFKSCHKYNPSLITEYEVIVQNEDGSVLYRKPNGEEILNDDSREFMKEFNLRGME